MTEATLAGLDVGVAAGRLFVEDDAVTVAVQFEAKGTDAVAAAAAAALLLFFGEEKAGVVLGI